MEFKQNKFLSAENQMVTANPDVNTVSVSTLHINLLSYFYVTCFFFIFLSLSYVMMMSLLCWHVMVSGKGLYNYRWCHY